MRQAKITIFIVTLLVLLLTASIALARPVAAPPTTPSSSSEALAVADGAPATAPGMEIVAQVPPVL